MWHIETAATHNNEFDSSILYVLCTTKLRVQIVDYQDIIKKSVIEYLTY